MRLGPLVSLRIPACIAAMILFASMACSGKGPSTTPAPSPTPTPPAPVEAVSSIAVTGNSPVLGGGPSQLTATAIYSDFTTRRDVTAQATWTSENPAVATVTAQGAASAVAAGNAVIQASFGGRSGSLGLLIAPQLPASTVQNSLNPRGSLANTDVALGSVRVSNSASESKYFDDFSLTNGGTIQELRWQGLYCQFPSAGPTASATATGFLVGFYADRGNVPEFTAIQQELYDISRVGQTLERNTTTSCASGTPGSPTGLYDYTLRLNTPFVARPGVRYWVSVQAQVPSTPPGWSWRAGTSGNNYAWASLPEAFVIPRDFAFALVGTP